MIKHYADNPRIPGSIRDRLRTLAKEPIGTVIHIDGVPATIRKYIITERDKGNLGGSLLTTSKAEIGGTNVRKVA